MAEFRTSKSIAWPLKACASVSTDLPLVTSRTFKDSLLFFFSSCCNSRLFSGLREVAITSHPSAAYCRTNSSPSPRFAPVIKTLDIICLLSARMQRQNGTQTDLSVDSRSHSCSVGCLGPFFVTRKLCWEHVNIAWETCGSIVHARGAY